MIKHIAIIADGNRRWAKEHNLPIHTGYAQGLVAIENCCEWAILKNIKYLTIYCFSTENWNRPEKEINILLELARQYFNEKLDWYIKSQIKVNFVGRKDRLAKASPELFKKLLEVAEKTSSASMLELNICIDYGGRDEIVRAVASGAKTEEQISAHLDIKAPDPDIIARTGGEMRLSNFLLWQAAYAELIFTPVYFPALNAETLDLFISEYSHRKRNFGH